MTAWWSVARMGSPPASSRASARICCHSQAAPCELVSPCLALPMMALPLPIRGPAPAVHQDIALPIPGQALQHQFGQLHPLAAQATGQLAGTASRFETVRQRRPAELPGRGGNSAPVHLVGPHLALCPPLYTALAQPGTAGC